MIATNSSEMCLLIRAVENKIAAVYASDIIQSPVHLSIGQEASAVGLCRALGPEDKLFINYRGHAHYLARGGDLYRFFCELMGRKDGFAKGKAGSMHLAAPDVGVYGASAIVGASLSQAVGSAYAKKTLQKAGRSVVVFGDGACEQGTFHESLNLASLWSVPVLFVCEDNQLAVHAFKEERQTFELSSLVSSYGIPFLGDIASNNPEEIESLIIDFQTAHGFSGPLFVQIKTFRLSEHVGVGFDWGEGYRNEEIYCGLGYQDWYVNTDKTNEAKILEYVDAVFDKASNCQYPSVDEVLTDV
jgi:TPP-dependent pyruvate/acetoin dehydrogenase alpha subunit